MRKFQYRFLLPAVLGGLASSSAMAGTHGVIIGFSTTASAVPLDHWTSVMLAATLAIAAYFLLRRQGGRISLWVMLAIITGASVYGLKDSKLISDALAYPQTFNVPLTSSPAVIDIWNLNGDSICTADINAINQTGKPVTITSINWQGSCSDFGVPNQLPQCTVGLDLAPGANCQLLSNSNV